MNLSVPRFSAFRSIVAGAVLAIAPAIADAQTITFTYTGAGASGTLAGAGFEQASFSIVAVGDVSSRQSTSNVYWIDHVSAMITINGLGTYNFITGTRTFVNNSFSAAGFSRAGSTGSDLFYAPDNPVFATWDMTTSIATIFGETRLLQWASSPQIQTSGGELFFNNSSDIASSFTAVVGAATTVPEPSTYVLMASGLLALAVVSRQRRNSVR